VAHPQIRLDKLKGPWAPHHPLKRSHQHKCDHIKVRKDPARVKKENREEKERKFLEETHTLGTGHLLNNAAKDIPRC